MTILSPTGLESTPMGVGGWNAINTANAERLNTQLERVWPMIDGETPADGQVAVYDAASGTWVPSDDVAIDLAATHRVSGMIRTAFCIYLYNSGGVVYGRILSPAAGNDLHYCSSIVGAGNAILPLSPLANGWANGMCVDGPYIHFNTADQASVFSKIITNGDTVIGNKTGAPITIRPNTREETISGVTARRLVFWFNDNDGNMVDVLTALSQANNYIVAAFDGVIATV